MPGNQRQVIFRSDPDCKYYLERLEKYQRAFCINRRTAI
jgi:hypothetical protein